MQIFVRDIAGSVYAVGESVLSAYRFNAVPVHLVATC